MMINPKQDMETRHQNIKDYSRRHDLAYWGLMVVACVVFYVLNLWTSFKEDDMEFSLLRNAGLAEFLRAQYDHFMTSNGRCADFFAMLFCAFLGKATFNVVNTLVFALMAHLVSLLSTGRRSVLALALFVACVGVCYPVPGQTMLMVAGSCNYMWGITASLLLVDVLRRVKGRPLGTVKTLLLMALAFVAGDFNEATSFGFLCGLVIYYALNRDQLDRNAKLALLAYFAGLVCIIASPAAWGRLSMGGSGGVAISASVRELLVSRCYIFGKMMLRSMVPVVAIIVGAVALLSKNGTSVKRCPWGYIMLCQMFMMFALGYLYDRAYAPLTTMALIIVIMAVDRLLMSWDKDDWGRLVVIVLCVALSGVAFGHAFKVLSSLKAFEDAIDHDIKAAPRQAILHEYRFNGYSRFATPLCYVSASYFNRESTYCAYYDKDNVQFVSDSVYERYHSGRLLDGAQVVPLVSDRPEIADTVLSFPNQDYMIVLVNADTLKPSPQFAHYYLYQSDTALTEQDRRYRERYGLETAFTPHSYYPLYFEGRQLLVLPLIDDVTSRIVLQLDYDGTLGNMTLSRPVSEGVPDDK